MRYIPVGRVVAAHGVKGEIKFRYYNDAGAVSLEYPSYFFERDGTYIELVPTSIRRQKDLFIIAFKGLRAMEQVGPLLKKELHVAEKDLPALEEDEYYDFQLVGLRVVTEEDRVVGTVRDVMHTRANAILVIEGVGEVLVPMTEKHIAEINRENGFVRVREDALVE